MWGTGGRARRIILLQMTHTETLVDEANAAAYPPASRCRQASWFLRLLRVWLTWFPCHRWCPNFASNNISCYIVQTRSMQRESFTPSPHHHNPHSPVIHACLVGTSLSDVEGLSGTQFRRSSVAEKAVYDGWGRLLSMLCIVTECPRQYSTRTSRYDDTKVLQTLIFHHAECSTTLP